MFAIVEGYFSSSLNRLIMSNLVSESSHPEVTAVLQLGTNLGFLQLQSLLRSELLFHSIKYTKNFIASYF